MQKHKLSSIEKLQEEIATWANKVMPDREPQHTFNKLVFEEIPELVKSGLNDPMEYADILILVLDLAYLKGIDAASAVREKMKINRARKWVMNSKTGIMSHVESGYKPEDQEDDGYAD